MADRYFAKPHKGLGYEPLLEWLNSQGDSAETLVKCNLPFEGRLVMDVIELTKAQVDALYVSEYQQMVSIFRQDTSGGVSISHYFPGWR